MVIDVTHFSDPGCPWAYSASPAHAVLRWRYGAQLRWRLVVIGLTEQADQYERRGYTPAGSARGYCASASAACRSRRAARAHLGDRPGVPGDRRDPATGARARAGRLPRAPVRLVHDAADPRRPDDLSRRSRASTASTPTRSSRRSRTCGRGRLPGRSRRGAHRRGLADRARARPRSTDGPVRYTAPSLIFERDGRRARGRRLPAGRGLRRADRQPRPEARAHAAARGPAGGLPGAPYGLITQEVAAVWRPKTRARPRGRRGRPDRPRRPRRVIRQSLADGALWQPASTPGKEAIRVIRG